MTPNYVGAIWASRAKSFASRRSPRGSVRRGPTKPYLRPATRRSCRSCAHCGRSSPPPCSPSPTDRSASPLSGSHRLLRWSTTSCAERSTNAPDSSGRVPTSRIGHELEAVSKDSEVATQKILAAAEDIDQAADTLAAALKDGMDRGLAQDIRDRVVQIFEACNFQDLTSQRVTKVIKTLKEIEAEIASA